MQQLLKLGIGSVVFLSAAFATPAPALGQLKPNWLQISEDRFFVIFSAPGLQGSNRRFYRGTTRRSVHYRGRWQSASGKFPRAEVQVTRIGARSIFTMGTMRGVGKFAEKVLGDRRWKKGQKGYIQNALGSLEYLFAYFADANCIFFYQYWRRDHIRNILSGYYCARRETRLSKAIILRVLKAIRARE